MAQFRLSFVFDTDNLQDDGAPEPTQDESAYLGCVSLMEWLVESGPMHVANFADYEEISNEA